MTEQYLSDFDFELPQELIAQYPLENRDECRLLHVIPQGGLEDLVFHDIVKLLRPGDLMVMNNTFVIKARLRGHKATGGAIEALIERVTGEKSAIAMIRASKSPKPGSSVVFENPRGERLEVKVLGREGEFFELEFPEAVLSCLDRFGKTPLPPYIERDANAADESTYQTVYAKIPGAVAAPTAGLHFTKELLEEIRAKGVEEAYVTLHVGAGTFQPVREEKISEHKMHSEWYSVSEEVAEKVNRAKAEGRRVVAVGTTSLRTLEAAAVAPGRIRPGSRDTTLFITPGYRFSTIDALITNFHLPKSTLVMLVSAIAGRERILSAYRHAIEQRYRFFSYGDAMFLENAPQAS
ncbi:tRNA preQ1(34) S-adenosylmethionine ribosyltransferase-isomerase QueA [Mesosutterella sp. OilRF-GAM-744-9]|uniref:S-adenosylmethionine:tRNA ribosyltransferase-isomerase n=1 Tax=Mesosutterella porci TaxID=2915351 RepID=A0ABS9MSG5_9BURK|nr:tRNA preQ1(34) S-adenosylmethionine ribosyltransferase-isomerase QueA [Mesosutterella sp. oilRF-744-WT-GAM-9]MCG5031327.1 tRNA preQ1(34) S-adenosylmethionine ribosyltransferase-isomerase QueA [Mesosutterella sp. oilRF-744-WT-GAM-9]MCI6529859.1 tRNA preQ1(34) S-adenosylmethionine ribosyltransferase-isomerase QueA [Mesosutterella sp.]